MSAQSTFDYVPDEPKEKPQEKAAPAAESAQEVIPPGEVGTALAVVEEAKKNNLLVVALSTEKGLAPLIEKIKERVKSEVFDVTTEKGRKRIGSVARDIGEAKMDLKRMGQTLTEDWRTKTKAVTSETSRMEKELDALRDEVLAPRIEYDNIEKTRVEGHQQRLQAFSGLSVFTEPPTSAAVQGRIDMLSNFTDFDWQEFTESAKATRQRVETILSDLLVKTKKAEEDAAELDRLRKEKADREQKERDEKIATEAATKAKAEAEEKARKEQEEKDRIAKAEQERLQREKDAADARAKKAEEDRIESEKKAEQEKRDALEKSKREALAAVEKERQRIEAEKKAEAEAATKREADQKHRAKINNEILVALKTVGMMDDQTWKDVITAIAQGKIPHVSIKY